jgi:hypothetical protein
MTDYYFWFTQPPTAPTVHDLWAFYIFAGMVLASGLLFALRFSIKHTIVKQALRKFIILLLTVGIVGIIWYAFRFEGTPIFAKRIWAGLILLGGVIWIGFVLKYMLFRFNADKSEYDNNLLKSKYLPKRKN